MEISEVDLVLVERLLARYRATFRDNHYSGQWAELFQAWHQPLHDVFMRGSVEEAAAALRDPASNYLFYGYESTMAGHFDDTTTDTRLLEQLRLAVGGARLELQRPTSLRYRIGTWRKRRREGAAPILDDLDRVFGRIDFPNPYRGECGIVTPRGVASERAINAIYQAWQLKGRVLEIGGGLGRTAYYAARFGVTDYTIADLPFSSIAQGYFLWRTLGHNAVRLISPDEFFAEDTIYDVILNADSLTELSRELAERYAAEIRKRCRLFISINHEANAFTMRELFGKPASRHQYWLRPGYVEERFAFQS